MPLTKKDAGGSFRSKLKNAFSKNKDSGGNLSDADNDNNSAAYPRQQAHIPGHANGANLWARPQVFQPSLSPENHPAQRWQVSHDVGYRGHSPGPPPAQFQRGERPSQGSRSDQYHQASAPVGYLQQSPLYRPEFPGRAQHGAQRFDPAQWQQSQARGPPVPFSPAIATPHQMSHPSSANGARPPPQFIIDEAPDQDSDSDSDLVVLVPTNDGRYLPVALKRDAIARVPSPSVLMSGRGGVQEVDYLDSDPNSSEESLFRPPRPTDRRIEYDSRRENVRPTFREMEDEDDNDDGAFGSQLPGVATPGSRTPAGPDGPNLNRRYDYLPGSMVPSWYRKNAEIEPDSSLHYLCSTCRHIDLLELFKQEETDVMPKPRDYIVLGPLKEIIERPKCGLCSLVVALLVLDTVSDLPRSVPEEERKQVQKVKILELFDEIYYLCPIRFKTTYRTPKLYIFSGKELENASRNASVIRPRQTMAIRPFHKDGPNLGRMLKTPDTMDFEWIRQRMRLCDERDDGRHDYSHDITVRGIDVDRMCLVDLPPRARYVTLSYTWGRVNQLQLLSSNHASFRNGALEQQWTSIPKTIQDSIKLVRKIGERFLWVDALCIIQDDPEDKLSQINHMGDIYRDSILTICACCGQDANYGLPGVDPGTRTTRQVYRIVGQVLVGNALPDAETVEGTKWDTRGWTLQEKVLSQRKLQISDECAQWWCWHTITTEDENCRHCWWEPGTEHSSMIFFKSEHDQVVSKIGRNSNLDTYAFIVADYTARDLTFDSDAEHAARGALNAIEGLFRGKFESGLPDTELIAALLWCPVGSSRRRRDPLTGEPVFPSWTWLGWAGPTAYPWLIERNIPMSEEGTTLVWRNALDDADDDDLWFSSDEYRVPAYPPNFLERREGRPDRWRIDDFDGWTWIDNRDEGHRWVHPTLALAQRQHSYFHGPSRQLRFRTLCASFTLDPHLRTRKLNYDHLHKLHFARVLNDRGFSVGHVHVPSDFEIEREAAGRQEFIVLSRSSTNPDPRIGIELLYDTPVQELHSVYSMMYMLGAMDRLKPSYGDDQTGEEALGSELDEIAYFDTRLYDATTPWGLFNVMMIEWRDGVASRIAVGRIHCAAFMEASPVQKEIVLG